MILIGMYDSPFVRRVAIALRIYDMDYEHRNWSVFRDADTVAEFNPLIRVPTLVLDDGEVLVESAAILDALDEMAGPQRSLTPAFGPGRRLAMKIMALASGVGDKAVSLLYERRIHGRATPDWVDRCCRQIVATLDMIEADRASRDTPWWFGDVISQADITVACMLGLVGETSGDLIDLSRWPALAAHCTRCEALDDFKATYQPYAPLVLAVRA